MGRFILAVISSVTLAAAPVLAAGQHGAKPANPHPSVKTTHVGASQKPAPAVKPTTSAKPVKPTAPPKPKKTESAAGKTTAPVKTTTAKANAKKTPAETTTTVTVKPVATTGTLTPVQEKLQQNTNLASKVQSRLPAGTNLMTAAEGFRNLGQFVAAVNVSNNLGIAFADLKTKMVTENKSLGQSIQALRPVSSATIEAQHGEAQARSMIVDSEREPAPPVKPTAKPKMKSTTAGGTTSK